MQRILLELKLNFVAGSASFVVLVSLILEIEDIILKAQRTTVSDRRLR